MDLDRRSFLAQAAGAVGAAWTSNFWIGKANADVPATQMAVSTQPATQPTSRILRAGDEIVLGKTGIRTSRLAFGTGTVVDHQAKLGHAGLTKLFRHALDHNVRWWDAADLYKTHPHIAHALKEVKREQVVITSKVHATTAADMHADIERFRKEMDTDYIDIVLLHCMTDSDWPEKFKGVRDALSEEQSKGRVRAVGCSCHSLDALNASANSPWVQVQLARVNPFAVIMDVNTPEEVHKVTDILHRIHKGGKGVYAMKICGEGRLKGDRIDESLRFVLSQSCVDGFVIGFEGVDEFDDMLRRIEQASAALPA